MEIGFAIDERRVMAIISPSDVAASPNPDLEVENAMKNPIAGVALRELSPRRKTIAIAVDDMTRATPSRALLRVILRLLKEAGARKQNIKIVVALGTHRPMTDQEMKEKYGAETVEEYEVVNHVYDEESELEFLGRATESGLPVWINKHYVKADLRMATGNLIPHFNAGWGAGAKILLPGLAGEETVGRMHVHSALTTPNGLGAEENPTRRLIEAFAEKVGVHMLVNTALTRHGEIAKVFAGDLVRAHRSGIDFAKRIYGVEMPGLATITISSSHPADIEYWQGQKGLFSADLATKPGGGIIHLTPCPEGLSVAHPKWIDYLQHNSKELKKIYEAGEVDDLVALGPALNIAYLREKHRVCIVSDGISERDATRMGFRKFNKIEDALDFLSRSHGGYSRVNVLTHGGESYPLPRGLRLHQNKIQK
jgi:nickel-dependent lactate racemase